jgi:hypothetical protein
MTTKNVNECGRMASWTPEDRDQAVGQANGRARPNHKADMTQADLDRFLVAEAERYAPPPKPRRVTDQVRIDAALAALLATGATVENGLIDNLDDKNLALAIEYLIALAGAPAMSQDEVKRLIKASE